MHNYVLVCETSYQPQTWPFRAVGGLALDTAMIGNYADDQYQWRLVVSAENVVAVREGLRRAGIRVQHEAQISLPPAPPSVLWPGYPQAVADLRERYGDSWELRWTAQEAADFTLLAEQSRQALLPSERNLTPLDRALQRASWRYLGRKNMRPDLIRPDHDEHYLAVLNILRQRAGLYPVDAKGTVVLPEYRTEAR